MRQSKSMKVITNNRGARKFLPHRMEEMIGDRYVHILIHTYNSYIHTYTYMIIRTHTYSSIHTHTYSYILIHTHTYMIEMYMLRIPHISMMVFMMIMMMMVVVMMIMTMIKVFMMMTTLHQFHLNTTHQLVEIYIYIYIYTYTYI